MGRFLLTAYKTTCFGIVREVNEIVFAGKAKRHWKDGIVGGTCIFDDQEYTMPQMLKIIKDYYCEDTKRAEGKSNQGNILEACVECGTQNGGQVAVG